MWPFLHVCDLLLNFIAPKPEHFFSAHAGTVKTIERSPFFSDIILSVGGWNFCIWKDGITVRNYMYMYMYNNT